MRRVHPRFATFGAFALLALASRTAAADDPTQAQSLFDRARELMERGDFEHACPLFVESQRLDPGGGTLLNIAVCHERQGKIATAWAEYGEALGAATRDGREDRQKIAREHAEALRPRLPRIRVVVLRADDALVVALDDHPLAAVSLGLDLPVDPGAHVVAASMPGRRSWSTHASVAEGQSIEVTVPELDVEAPPPPPESRIATMTWVLGGVAIVAVGTTVVTGLMALSADRSANDKCLPDRSYCPDASYADDASRARTLAWVSTGALVVGAGAAVGALLWPREKITVTATPSSAGLSARFFF